MVRVVIDTNVLVSAMIRGGKPRRLVVRLLEGHGVIASSQMLAELADVLTRAKFGVSDSQVQRYLSILVSGSEVVSVMDPPTVVPADPDDDLVLDTARRGKADYIVSGDRHLLRLKTYRGMKMVSVAKLLELVATS